MRDGVPGAGPAPTLPINLRMAESLRAIDGALMLGGTPDLVSVARHLEDGGTMQPQAFGAYFELVRALQDPAEPPVVNLLETLAASARPADAGIAIRLIGFDDFTRPALREARVHFASDSLTWAQMRPIPPGSRLRVTRSLERALELIRTRAPRAWQDISRITTEIIAAYGASRGITTFDGCSSLERHGSILVNMRRRRTPLVMAETLVHESAHSLLFALSCTEHRVLNPPDERYKSPLRIDPRPLDGIYHAAFVLARMHGFLAEVALHPDTSPAMRAEARDVMGKRRTNFTDGYDVLIAHARFTDSGRALMEESRERVEQDSAAVSAAA